MTIISDKLKIRHNYIFSDCQAKIFELAKNI